MVSEARDITPTMLGLLFGDKQWQKFTSLLQLLEKNQQPNEQTITYHIKEALQAYMRSTEFRAHPEKLVAALQAVRCSFEPKEFLEPKTKVAETSSAPPSPTNLSSPTVMTSPSSCPPSPH